ncbi:hypothetical protein C8J57DRAFT_1554975 [Mycena rebaudengoi]|nr:hypothetical protein C8J57DRAFT_1554975 [Mycena rebaudengoi]
MLSLSTLSSFFFVSSKGFVTSKSLVSFFGGVLVASQVSVVVISSLDFKAVASIVDSGFIKETPTPTTVILEPTRCTPSNGNGNGNHHCFIFGFLIIMLVSLVSTLGATGGFSKSAAIKLPPDYPVLGGNQQIILPAPPANWRNLPVSDARPPPPPPAEPGTEINAKPPRSSYFLLILLVFAVFVVLLIGVWININIGIGMPKTLPSLSVLCGILSRLWTRSIRLIIVCVGLIKQIARSITRARMVNVPAAVYLAASNFRGLNTSVSFNFPVDPADLPSSYIATTLIRFMTLGKLLDEYLAAGIRAVTSCLANAPWIQIARTIAMVLLSVLVYRFVLYISRALTHWLNRRTARLEPGEDFLLEFCKFTLMFYFPFWVLLRILMFVDDVIRRRLWDDHVRVVSAVHTALQVLSQARTLFGSSVSLLLALFSPLEQLAVFGPASALAVLLVLHVPLWILKCILLLHAKSRSAIAAFLAWSLVYFSAMLVGLTGAKFASLAHTIVEHTAPVWNPLPLGYKIVLVTLPLGLRFSSGWSGDSRSRRAVDADSLADNNTTYLSGSFFFSSSPPFNTRSENRLATGTTTIRQPEEAVNAASTADTTTTTED